MAKFEKGKSGNEKGCPKGAHHVGRPSSIVKRLAEEASPDIMRRFIRIANGEDLEQVVNGEGETLRVPAPVREQLKAGEFVLKVGVDLEVGDDQEQSRINAAKAHELLKEIESRLQMKAKENEVHA